MARDTTSTPEPAGKLSRRRLLQMMGMLGVTGAAAVSGVAALSRLTEAGDNPVPAHPGSSGEAGAHQWVFIMDLRNCDGCEQCTAACQKMHYLNKDQTWIKVFKLTSAAGQDFFMPRSCMQCEVAPCVSVCPVGASFKSPDGITLIDSDKCIGCRMCMAACPYGARYFNWTEPPKAPAGMGPRRPEYPVPQQKGTVGKCVMCVHNLRYGKLPGCVEACHMGALYVGDRNTDLATNGQVVVKLSEFLKAHDATRFKEELNTRPRVYYILGHGQSINF